MSSKGVPVALYNAEPVRDAAESAGMNYWSVMGIAQDTDQGFGVYGASHSPGPGVM